MGETMKVLLRLLALFAGAYSVHGYCTAVPTLTCQTTTYYLNEGNSTTSATTSVSLGSGNSETYIWASGKDSYQLGIVTTVNPQITVSILENGVQAEIWSVTVGPEQQFFSPDRGVEVNVNCQIFN
jgi:hypothetical protein